MKILLGIIGLVLFLPIAMVLVLGIVSAMIGAYTWLILKLFGEVVIAIVAIILVVKLIKYFINR